MRRSRPLRVAALVLTVGIAMTGCSKGLKPTVAVSGEPAGEAQAKRIPDVLAQDSDDRFTTLLACVEIAGLGTALQDPGPLTLFAPTNGAFRSAGVSCDKDTKVTPELKETLTRTLLQHVVTQDIAFKAPEKYDSAKAPRGLVIVDSSRTISPLLRDAVSTSLVVDAKALTVRRAGDTKVARILGDEIIAPNGYIHVLDSVIVPPAKDKVPPTTALPKPFSS